MFYKNISGVTRTVYGVTFAPNEAKAVFGVINAPGFIRVSAPTEETSKPAPTSEKKAETTPAAEAPKKSTTTKSKKEVTSDGSNSD